MTRGEAVKRARHNGQTTKVTSWFAYHCPACDVDWVATDGERIPTTCWMCERPTGVVKTQAGIPVRYYEEVGL